MADEATQTVITILVLVVGGIIFFAAANVALYYWARSQVGAEKPRKKVGAKKLKREKLKMGIRPAGED